MHKVNVIIGDFRRRNFGEGLLTRLSDYEDFVVTGARTHEINDLLNRMPGLKVLILDAADNGINIHDLLINSSIAVIVIGDEGRYANVHLHQIDAAQIAQIVTIAARKQQRSLPPPSELQRTVWTKLRPMVRATTSHLCRRSTACFNLCMVPA